MSQTDTLILWFLSPNYKYYSVELLIFYKILLCYPYIKNGNLSDTQLKSAHLVNLSSIINHRLKLLSSR